MPWKRRPAIGRDANHLSLKSRLSRGRKLFPDRDNRGSGGRLNWVGKEGLDLGFSILPNLGRISLAEPKAEGSKGYAARVTFTVLGPMLFVPKLQPFSKTRKRTTHGRWGNVCGPGVEREEIWPEERSESGPGKELHTVGGGSCVDGVNQR